MIFVTVGSTGPFDELLAEVDRLAEANIFGENVICQSGQSKYRMRHAEQFVGRPSIAGLIAQSSFVISHGGSTVIELLRAKKCFVAFPNTRLADDHQTIFLRELAAVAGISWSRDVRDLARLYRERRALGPAVLKEDFPRAGDIVRELGARTQRSVPRTPRGFLGGFISRARFGGRSATKLG